MMLYSIKLDFNTFPLSAFNLFFDFVNCRFWNCEIPMSWGYIHTLHIKVTQSS